MRTPLFVQNNRLFADTPSDLTDARTNVMNILRKDAAGSGSLLAHEQTIPDLTVFVQSANNIAVNGVNIDFLGGSSPVFVPPLTGTRTDLLAINNAGTLVIYTNTSGVANYPVAARAIAEILLIAGDTEIIDNRITDVRQFFGGGALPPSTVTTILAGSDADNAPTNTLYSVSSGSYTIGSGSVAVYLDGIRMVSGVDFTEETTTSIRLGESAIDTQTIMIITNDSSGIDLTTRVAKAGDTMTGILQLPELNVTSSDYRIYVIGDDLYFEDVNNPGGVSLTDLFGSSGLVVDHFDDVAIAAQTLFTLPFNYSIGTDKLQVYVNGLLQRITDDYTETSTTEVTFGVAFVGGEKVTFHYAS